jgi:uncharacterized protein YecE (DUF72 family)
VRAFADGVLNSKEITHDRDLVGVDAEAERGVLDDFLARLVQGFRYVAELRHRSWLGSDQSPSTLERFLEIRRGER